MRLVQLALLFSVTAAGIAAAQSYEVPTEIALSGSARTQGVVGAGQQRAYSLKILSDGPIVFDVQADNDTCGYELKTSSRRGFLTTARRFPVHYTTNARQGETYVISFFQNRASWIEKSTCSYAFSVRQSP